MREIKSVRVRRTFASSDENLSGIGDYKVTLYDNGNNKFKVGVNQSGKPTVFAEYKREGKFSNFTNDDFIKDGINILIVKQNNNNSFDIIQDPWSDEVPKWRNFGFNPYYLNNGSVVYITWSNDSGTSWSDNNGNELDTQRGLTQSIKSSIVKNIKIISDSERLEVNKNGIISKYELNGRDYIGTIKDIDIINELINLWKMKVPNYDLKLCDPNYIKCEIIPYISPIDNLDKNTEPEKTNSTEDDKRIEMKVVIPQNLEIKVKQDIPSLKIYFGDVEDNSVFIFDDSEDLLLLSDEFVEGEFRGLEEIYEGPDPNATDETQDFDLDKGGVDVFNTTNYSISDLQLAYIKRSINSTGPGGPGKCARYTYNHANNYCLQILKKEPAGVKYPAGGNANQEGYHKNLERLGYKRYDQGIVTKEKITQLLRSGNWNIGDVVAYWGITNDSSLKEKGGIKYGHTQIYTAGKHNNSSYHWSSDETNNFKSGFVYGSYKVSQWRFIIFKAPIPPDSTKMIS